VDGRAAGPAPTRAGQRVTIVDEQRTCPSCGEPVGDTDTICPNCGESLVGG
jgi:predicted amidophosphoribosyltransferase